MVFVNKCYAVGNVTASVSDEAGGLIGQICVNGSANVKIQNCYSMGSVTGELEAGGILGTASLIGNSKLTISNTYSTGTIAASAPGYAGGIVGAYNQNMDAPTLNISNCVALNDSIKGAADSSNRILGGSLGGNAGTLNLTDNYAFDKMLVGTYGGSGAVVSGTPTATDRNGANITVSNINSTAGWNTYLAAPTGVWTLADSALPKLGLNDGGIAMPAGLVSATTVYIPSLPTGGSTSVEVNGKAYSAGTTQTTTGSDGKTVTVVTVDTNKLNDVLNAQGSGATVTIPVSSSPDKASGVLTGDMVKAMESKDAQLVIQTASASYTLPASQINIDSVSRQLGTSISLSDIKVSVSIAEPTDATVKVVAAAAADGGFTVQVPSVDFAITCTCSGQTVDVSSFNSYVERMIAIPSGVDPNKITTGIVVKPDGTTYHVPTKVILNQGAYYAVINSLTNSTYTIVYHPVSFSDVTNHWAKDAVNDMGSRMVVFGDDNGRYNPDNKITRAEFAAIVVRALGLAPGTGISSFKDVASSDWYNSYVITASANGIIKGYDANTFAPNELITREQAMTMIARAMKITGIKSSLTDSEVSALLANYTDGASVSGYTKTSVANCLETGVVTGMSSTALSPKANVTRAEVAVMVQRMLQKSGLI